MCSLILIYYLQVVLVTQSRKKAEAANEKLAEEKAALEEILAQGDTAVREMEGKMRKVEGEKKALDAKVSSREIDGYANDAARAAGRQLASYNSSSSSSPKMKRRADGLWNYGIHKLCSKVDSVQFVSMNVLSEAESWSSIFLD